MNNTIKKSKCQDKEKREHLSKYKEKQVMKNKFVEYMQDKNLKIEKLEECSNQLSFLANEGKTKFMLHSGNFCRNRFCPTCSWLRAKSEAFQLLELMKVIQIKENLEFIFMTLTAKNVTADRLRDEITDFNRAYKRLFQTKAFEKINKGFVRKLEVTYNQEADTYHPHFHVIVAVNRSYFKSRDYISERKLLEMWQVAKRDKSITQVDLRKCNMKTVKDALELATYSAKQSQLYSTKEQFDVFYSSLKGRQLITFAKIFQDYKKKLEDGLIDVDEIMELAELKEKAIHEIYYLYEKEQKDYREMRERELREHEQKSFYNLEIDVDKHNK